MMQFRGICRPEKANSDQRFVGILLALIVVSTLSSCAALPEERRIPATYALKPHERTIPIAPGESDLSQCGRECSGFVALNRGEAAFRWRLAFADIAKKSIDVQYYLWHGDASGMLLISRLLSAADRGVRVRLLIDDTKLLGVRRAVVALNLHPHIEVRTFNPFTSDSILGVSRALEFFIHMDRLNHRMHNKLMIVDNIGAIVGGRNIGDAYFGLDAAMNFRDMELLTIGPIVRNISDSFDLYWNSQWSYPPDVLTYLRFEEKSLIRLRKKIQNTIAKNKDLLATFAREPRDWNHLMARLSGDLIWAKARVLYDQPPTREGIKPVQMARAIGRFTKKAQKEMFIITPYLIPSNREIQTYRDLVAKGVNIQILTNSLASNDVVIANTGYKRYRKQLVEAGVTVYELRADAARRAFYDTPPIRSKWLGLHAKVIICDRQRVYVGTMNLDPRSAIHNTEIGLLVDSPQLAEHLHAVFDQDLIPENSWRVGLDENGLIFWSARGAKRYTQPARSFRQRLLDWLLPASLFEDHL